MSFSSILHPTDFSRESTVAFKHALKLALERKSKLVLMNVMSQDAERPEWENFPGVRSTLSDWGMIDKNAQRHEVFEKLGIKAKKIIGKGEDTLDSIIGIIYEEEIDLLVLSTEGREGIPRWLKPSLSESISKQALLPTLFVPHNCKPFVSESDGKINIKSILIPIDHQPKPQRAIEFANNFRKYYCEDNISINVLHILEDSDNGKETNMPELVIPEDENFIVRLEPRQLPIDEEILKVAEEIDAGLIIIPTEGQTGFLDALYGSTSQQLLRKSICPVLTIPVAHGKYLIRD